MLTNLMRILPITLLLVLLPGGLLQAQSLKGSRAVMERQNQMAISYGYSFLKTSKDVHSFYENGYLVEVANSDTLEIHNVSFPYARAEVKLFLERLSRQYLNACSEKLVVTSLTRPLNKQPGNASDVSVHPTGMALDLRIPHKGKCRSWLEKTLLSLEKANVLDVTRERRPPHFHVALFTKSYGQYVATLEKQQREKVVETRDHPVDYEVRRGDSLTLIAQRYDTTIEALRSANTLRSNVLQIGQVLTIPAMTTAETPSPEFIGPTTVNVAAASNQQSDLENALPDLLDALEQLAQDNGQNYTVRRGDSLARIAQRYDTTIEDLRSANTLRSNVLQIGQVLTIPAESEIAITEVAISEVAIVETVVTASTEATATNPATSLPVFVGPTTAQLTLASDQQVVVENTLPDLMDDAEQAEQQAQSVEKNYTVQSGDSLFLIAERHDTTIEALRAANNLRSIVLQIGQELTIPGDVDTTLAMLDVPELIHRVRRGDTLWDIASEYRISINRLKAMNGLSGEMLQVGQVLKVSGN